jgi:DNA polymerase-3 subunit alpha
MKYDPFGQAYTNSDELINMLYQNPNLDLSRFQVEDPHKYNNSVRQLFADLPTLTQYVDSTDRYDSVEQFDAHNQNNWHMPDEYRSLDIAQWILEQCQTDPELQRCGEELLLYQERNLMDLLRYLKYLVDVLRANNIVWGVGRGSSVSSYVLYKIGVHRIDSLYYDLDPAEFLK